MCSKPCFGTCCGVFLFILALCALSTPWYFYSTRRDTSSSGSCTTLYLFHWRQAYCSTDNDNSDCLKCVDDNFNWRNTFPKSTNTAKVFDTALGLMIVTTLFSLAGMIYFCVRQCNQNQNTSKRSYLHIAAVSLGSLFALVSIAYFAGQLPTAFKDDGLFCDGGDTSDSPCQNFIGSNSIGNADVYWGAVGWYAGLLALIINLIAIGAASMNFDEQTVVMQYYAMPVEGGAYVPPAQQYAAPAYATPTYVAPSNTYNPNAPRL